MTTTTTTAEKSPAEALAEVRANVQDGIARCRELARNAGDDYLVGLQDTNGNAFHFAKRDGAGTRISFATLAEHENGTVVRLSRAGAERLAARFTTPVEGFTVFTAQARSVYETMMAGYFATLRSIERLPAAKNG